VGPITVAGDLGGQTLAAGLYKSTSSLGITGVLTLNGGGNPNSVFIFQVASALTTATSSQVALIGGAQAANIFWQVGSSASLGTYSTFNGTILAQASVTVATGAVLNGRALARTGAVTLDTNSVVNPGAPVTSGAPPALSGFTCPVGTASVGVAYNSFVVPTGGTSPYTFSITSGSLPPGSPVFSLNTSTGDLTGTPTGATSTYIFGVNVTDSASGNVSASCTIAATGLADQADVTITKSGPTPPTVAPNTNIPYTIVVTNAGPASAAGVTVTDILPAGTTFVSATSPCTASTGTVTCNLGTMPSSGSGSSVTINLVVVGPSSSGSFDNTATVVSTTADPNTTNNRSTATVTVNITSVPTLSTWGLALLALLLLLAGCAALFGRKAQA
jgi:type VI secretion system secreted protein VgrG